MESPTFDAFEASEIAGNLFQHPQMEFCLCPSKQRNAFKALRFLSLHGRRNLPFPDTLFITVRFGKNPKINVTFVLQGGQALLCSWNIPAERRKRLRGYRPSAVSVFLQGDPNEMRELGQDTFHCEKRTFRGRKLRRFKCR